MPALSLTEPDQSGFTLALVNCGMWVSNQYFPATYAYTTWKRLVPFSRLPGCVAQEQQAVLAELRSFNDRQLTRDVSLVCGRVAAGQLRLPDGRRLCFTIEGIRCLAPPVHQCQGA